MFFEKIVFVLECVNNKIGYALRSLFYFVFIEAFNVYVLFIIK